MSESLINSGTLKTQLESLTLNQLGIKGENKENKEVLDILKNSNNADNNFNLREAITALMGINGLTNTSTRPQILEEIRKFASITLESKENINIKENINSLYIRFIIKRRAFSCYTGVAFQLKIAEIEKTLETAAAKTAAAAAAQAAAEVATKAAAEAKSPEAEAYTNLISNLRSNNINSKVKNTAAAANAATYKTLNQSIMKALGELESLKAFAKDSLAIADKFSTDMYEPAQEGGGGALSCFSNRTYVA
jgi:hypothetical protein